MFGPAADPVKKKRLWKRFRGTKEPARVLRKGRATGPFQFRLGGTILKRRGEETSREKGNV